MSDRMALLDQLTIERSHRRAPRSEGGRTIIAGGVAVLMLATAGWFIISPTRAVMVDVARARAVVPTSAASGASLLDASGYVVARRRATVSAKITGRVVAVDIEEGQRVEKDQIIARLDDSNTKASLDAARAQVGLAEARLQAARTSVSDNLPIFQRSEKLREKGWVSDTEFDATRTTYDKSKSDGVVAERNLDVARNDVEVALRNEDDTIIRAPFSGVVTVKDAQPGEVISPLSTGGFTRTGICTIVDMDSLEIEVDVSENFINRVHSRQNAVLQLNAYPDWRIPARVVATIPSADRAKATVKVRLEIEAKDPRILPDMGARVSFLDDTPPPVTHESGARLMVPVAAVSRQDDKTFVFVLRGNTIERRAISVGRESGGELEVLSGLQADTQLAIGDFSKLQDGAQVDVRNN